jgi:hypothetical protein
LRGLAPALQRPQAPPQPRDRPVRRHAHRSRRTWAPTTAASFPPSTSSSPELDRRRRRHACRVRETLRPPPPADRWPSVAGVRETNFCDIGWAADEATHHLILVSAIDNLVSAAGQAIQCMNCRFGRRDDRSAGGRTTPGPLIIKIGGRGRG